MCQGGVSHVAEEEDWPGGWDRWRGGGVEEGMDPLIGGVERRKRTEVARWWAEEERWVNACESEAGWRVVGV